MNSSGSHWLWNLIVLAAIGSQLTACSVIYGDIEPVKQAQELAINCKTDEALAELDRVAKDKNIASAMSDLERIVILQDAGRDAEANAALAERNKRWEVDEKNAEETDKAIKEAIANLRAEREKRTGKATCE